MNTSNRANAAPGFTNGEEATVAVLVDCDKAPDQEAGSNQSQSRSQI